MLSIIDPYYLTITAIITIAYQLFFYAIAVLKRFDKVTDFAGGTNFIVLALFTFFASTTFTARQILVTIFQSVWGIRLAGFLLYRILKTKQDNRFNDIRESALSFLGFWIFQMLWVWIVSLPVVLTNSPAYSTGPGQPLFDAYIALDIVGIVLWVVGFLAESIADQQKYTYKMSPTKDAPFMKSGLWSWSRHPNYWGEITLWIGVWLLSLPPVLGTSDGVGYMAVASPIFTMVILLFLSGLPLNERPVAERYYNQGHWDAYRDYLQKTSILVPMPPAIYKHLPQVVKTVLLLDWPVYRFTPPEEQEQERFV